MENINNNEVDEILQLMNSTDELIEQSKIENKLNNQLNSDMQQDQIDKENNTNDYNFRSYEDNIEYIKYKKEMQLRNPDKLYEDEEDYSNYEIEEIEFERENVFSRIFMRHKFFWIIVILILIINIIGKIINYVNPNSSKITPKNNIITETIQNSYSDDEINEIINNNDTVQNLLNSLSEKGQSELLKELGISDDEPTHNKDIENTSTSENINESQNKNSVSKNSIGRGNISIPNTKEINEEKTEIVNHPNNLNVQKTNIYYINGNNDLQMMINGNITNVSLIGIQDLSKSSLIKNYISNGQEIYIEFDKNQYSEDEVMCCYLWLNDPSLLAEEEYSDNLLNYILIKDGIVKYQKDKINNKYEKMFLNAESMAVLYKKGIWE